MKCSCCGREVKENERYCNYCGENNENYGKKIVEVTPVRPTPQLTPQNLKPIEQVEVKNIPVNPKPSIHSFDFNFDVNPETKKVPEPKTEHIHQQAVKNNMSTNLEKNRPQVKPVEVKREPKSEQKEKIDFEYTIEVKPQEVKKQPLTTEKPMAPIITEVLKPQREKEEQGIVKENVKYVKLEPLGNLLIKKETYSKLYFNTKILVPIGFEALIYKNNALFKVIYEGGEEILNPGKKGLLSNKKDDAVYTIFTINTNCIKNEKWGTKYPIPYDDKELGTIIQLNVIGSYKYSISDPEVFISRVVGDHHTYNNDTISEFFNEMILQDVTATIAKELTERNYFELYQVQGELSETLKEICRKKLNSYGVGLKEFIISAFKVEPDWVIEEHRKLKFVKNQQDIVNK